MTKPFSFFLLVLILSTAAILAHATELTDLGEGLSYLRVHALDESAKGLAAAIRERDFLVLDLRYVTTVSNSAELLGTALKAREAKPPVFILVGPVTPPALGESLASVGSKIVTLGIKESVPAPQVVIDQPADADRRAYAALDAGKPLADLISGKITKERYDEAALMKEFSAGNNTETTPAKPDPTANPTGTEKAPPPATNAGDHPAAARVEPPAVSRVEPLVDRVLQRAVHLHRALAAIKQR